MDRFTNDVVVEGSWGHPHFPGARGLVALCVTESGWPFPFRTRLFLSVWMAGGGVQGGVVDGAADELGFHAALHRHYVTDIHATVLHLLGLDSHRLEIPGRSRLAVEHGKPIGEILG